MQCCPQVIQEVGLCICLRDILKSSEGLIGHGTGIVNVNGTTLLLHQRRQPDIIPLQLRG